MTKMALFLGCIIPTKVPKVEKAMRLIAPKLGLELVDFPFSCCPDPTGVKSANELLWLTLAARNLALVQNGDDPLPILALCNGCFETLKMAAIKLQDKQTLALVNDLLKPDGIEIKKLPEVYHVLDFLIKEVGIDKIKEQVVQSLDLRLSIHYGCHYTKPSNLLGTEKPDDPYFMHEILEVLGVEIQPYLEERLCCGAALRFVNNDLALEVLKEKLTSISAVKPDGVAIVCPTCFEAMDRGQKILSRKEESIQKTEFFFLEELLAKSMGFDL